MNNQAYAALEAGVLAHGSRSELVVPWWSFGKTIIAATALRLVDQGRLSLDAPLGGYTLRQLLRHEAGLTCYGGLADYHQAVAARDAPWSVREMLARAHADRLIYPPGAGWAYSNIGYLQARELVENAHGGDIGTAARALVFGPCGVEEVRRARTPQDLAGVEMGADRGYHPGWVYHGLFVGPLSAAAVLLDRLMDPAASPLSEASLTAMREVHALTEHATPPWTTPAYGLGLMCSATAGGWSVEGHTGGGPGTHVAVYRRTDELGRAVAVFAETDQQALVETLAVNLLA